MRVELPLFPPSPNDVPIHLINHLQVMTMMILTMIPFDSVTCLFRLEYEQLATMGKQPIINMAIEFFPRRIMS